jgi:hypothetical protein
MTTYHYIFASRQFMLEQEPTLEAIEERQRNYKEQEKEIDFWLVEQPAFLETPSFKTIRAKCAADKIAAIISTNKQFITWMKLRLEYAYQGTFEAPSEEIADPIASLEAASA